MKRKKILFWGFSRLSGISAAFKKYLESVENFDLVLQIRKNETTSDFVEIDEAEFIRADDFEIGALHGWISRSKAKPDFIIIDIFSIIMHGITDDFYSSLFHLLNLRVRSKFIIVFPDAHNFISSQVAFKNSFYRRKSISTVLKKISKVKSIIMNSSGNYSLFFVPPLESHFSSALSEKICMDKSAFVFQIKPKFICKYNFSFLSDASFFKRLNEEFFESQNSREVSFYFLPPDSNNPFFSMENKKKLSIKISMSSYYVRKFSVLDMDRAAYLVFLGLSLSPAHIRDPDIQKTGSVYFNSFVSEG